MTPSTIETAARRRLNATASTFWSAAEIIEDCLYFACMDMATRTKCIENTNTDTSVDGTSTYSFPTNAIEIKQVVYDGQKLEKMPERQFFALNLAGTTAPEGRPTHYFVWDRQIILYPTPDTSALVISMRTIDNPGTVTSGSTLAIPVQFHPRLVNGTCYYMLLKEVDDPRIPVFAARWQQDLVDTLDEWTRYKHADRLPMVRLEETSVTSDTGIV